MPVTPRCPASCNYILVLLLIDEHVGIGKIRWFLKCYCIHRAHKYSITVVFI